MNLKNYFMALLLLYCLPLAAELKVPAAILDFRQGPEYYLILVEKQSQTLYVYSNHKPDPLETFTITTGRIPGRKLAEGDMKTPEGVYIFQRILTGNELPKTDDYGDKAFTMNFPNPVDRLKGIGGSGIWLHGAFAPDKTDSPNNTRGCVVMQNDDLKKLAKYLYLNQTPIIIYEKIPWASPESLQSRRESFLEAIHNWKSGWENKLLDQYISYYHDSFSYRRMNLDAFRRYKDDLNRLYEFIRVFISNLRLFSHENSLLAIFDQMYVSDRNHFYTRKMQYWLSNGGGPKIVDEITTSLPGVPEVEISPGNFVSIEQFRSDYLGQMRERIRTLQPLRLLLREVVISPDRVSLNLNLDSGGEGLRATPVLLLKENEKTVYQSLESVSLNGGSPRDFNAGARLRRGNNTINLTIATGQSLRSLTIFISDEKNQVQQIITHIISQ